MSLMDRFAQILYDLGKVLNVDLYPDQNRICQLNYQDELHIQIQYDEAKESLLLATFVCDVPPGKYREKLLRAGLVNNQKYPRIGTLSYSEKNNKLTLFEYVSIVQLSGEKLFAILQDFIAKAKTWKEAVEKGGPLPVQLKKNQGPSIFGMSP